MLEETMGFSKHKTAPTTESDSMDVDKEESPEDRLATEQAKKLQNLAAKVEQFVEGEGDMEGARFEEYVPLILSTTDTNISLARNFRMKSSVTTQCLQIPTTTIRKTKLLHGELQWTSWYLV